MIGRIPRTHFDEVKQFLSHSYCALRDKLVHIFLDPNTVQSSLKEFVRVAQDREGTISAYINRLRVVAVKAYTNLTHEQRKPLLVAAFSRGLVDKGLATYLATINPKTSAKAERVALAGSAMRAEFKSRKTTGTYFGGEINSSEEEQNVDSKEQSQSELQLATAVPEQRSLGKPYGRPTANRRQFGSNRGCFGCGATDQFKADGPKRRSSRSQPFACDICDGAHNLQQCPEWEAIKRYGRSKLASKNNTTKADGTKTAPNNTSDTRVLEPDATMVVMADIGVQYSEREVACPAEDSDGTPRQRLFFVPPAVQSVPVWILADSGSERNLISQSFYKRLPFQPPIRQVGDVQVVGGNGHMLDLRNFILLPNTIGAVVFWHEFGIVRELPIDAIIGGDVLIPHQCTLQYTFNQQKKLEFGQKNCATCVINREDPESGIQIQMRFTEAAVQRRRNRLKLDPNFLAVLPILPRVRTVSGTASKSLTEPNGKVPESVQSQNGTGNSQVYTSGDSTAVQTAVKSASESSAGSYSAVSEASKSSSGSTSATNGNISAGLTQNYSGKLEQILSELKVSTLPI